MKKIVVTGGAGFVGSNLLNLLVKLGHEVLLIDNLATGKAENIPAGADRISFIKADITDRQAYEQEMSDFAPDTVIHLAAIHFIPYCNEHPEQTFKTNVMGTRNILDICRNIRPVNLIFASSAAVYGISDEPASENDIPQPTDIYGSTKLIGEDLCRLFHYDTGVTTVMCRIFNVYGPGETNPHVIPEIVEQFTGNSTHLEIGNISPKRDFIHVFDLAGAIVALMNKINSGVEVFNVGSGVEYSVGEIIDLCNELTGKNLEKLSTESRSRKSDRMHLISNIDKIKTATGWKPSLNIKDGLRKLISS